MMKFPLKLLSHPVRLRIIETLRILELASTQDICDFLDDVPASSIYRHLRLMREGGLIDVAETRTVNGSIERLYELRMPSGAEVIERDEYVSLSLERKLQHFSTVINSFMASLPDYLGSDPPVDEVFREVRTPTQFFYATPEELREIWKQIDAIIEKARTNPPSGGRKRYRYSSFTHPIVMKGSRHKTAGPNDPPAEGRPDDE
jgi:DNA-binding transcriptional ArsR family regulator